MEILRRSVEQLCARPIPVQLWNQWAECRRILQHLQPIPVRHVHHVESSAGQSAHEGYGRSVFGYWGWNPACSFIREAERLRRWPSVIFEARSLRRFHEEDRRHGSELALLGKHRDLYHL